MPYGRAQPSFPLFAYFFALLSISFPNQHFSFFKSIVEKSNFSFSGMPVFDDAHRARLATFSLYTPKFVLLLSCVMEFVIFFDRGVSAGSLAQIRQSPEISGGNGALSSTDSGLLTSLFIVGFSVFSPIFTSLGGKLRTRTILFVGLLIWMLSVSMCATAANYGTLLAGRGLSGVGESAFTPFLLVMLDNVAHPQSSRTLWLGLFWSNAATGTAAGMAVAGVVAPKTILGVSGWRFLFYVELAVGALIAVVLFFLPTGYEVYEFKKESVVLTADENEGNAADALQRASSYAAAVEGDAGDQQQQQQQQDYRVATEPPPDEEEEEKEPDEFVSLIPALLELGKNIDYVLLCLAYGAYQYVIGAISAFIVLSVVQSRIEVTQARAAILIGASLCFGGIFGSAFFGVLTDKLTNGGTNPRSVVIATKITVIAVIVALPLGAVCIVAQTEWLFVLSLVPSAFLLTGLAPSITVALLGVVRPNIRTYSIATQMFFCHILGDSISPVIVGNVASTFAGQCHGASRQLCESMIFTNATFFPDGEGSIFDGECKWIPGLHGEVSYCTNTMALPKSLLAAYAVGTLMIPIWGTVIVRKQFCSKSEGGGEA